MKFYVGTSGYSYPEWKGNFYPPDLPAQQMLRFYGERFHTVEINNTFYRMPQPSLLEGWASEVPPDFLFTLKVPQRITHLKRLRDVDDSLAYLFEVAGVLRGRLGPLLFQLPPDFAKDLALLRGLFQAVPPQQYRLAFEFRHPSWFDDEVFALLRRHQAALCCAEAEGGLEVPLVATAEWGYLRLRRQDYDAADLETWIQRVRAQPWREAFVYFKHEDQATGPLLARQFIELAG